MNHKTKTSASVNISRGGIFKGVLKTENKKSHDIKGSYEKGIVFKRN